MTPQNSPTPPTSNARAMSAPVQAADLTPAARDYLKLIWSAGEWSAEPVTIGGMAERMGLTASTVSEGVSKLASQGLVTHAKYGSVNLTAAGREYALLMVRRHRLLETFLVKVLGYGWDEVHLEAEVLEHAVSETMIARIDQLLGHPARDPHGDPIPSPDGQPHRPEAVQLTAETVGRHVTICRVSDSDPALLRYFAGLGLTPDTELTVRNRPPFAAGTTVRVAGQNEDISLGVQASNALWVVPGKVQR